MPRALAVCLLDASLGASRLSAKLAGLAVSGALQAARATRVSFPLDSGLPVSMDLDVAISVTGADGREYVHTVRSFPPRTWLHAAGFIVLARFWANNLRS